MKIKDLNIGFALTGSFCTIYEVIEIIKTFVAEGANVFPIISDVVSQNETRFTEPKILKEELLEITGNTVLDNIKACEPIGPKAFLDAIVVAPCTGNTLAKLANSITDSSVTMAVKGNLRNNCPVVLAISTNDGLSGNAKNIGTLLNTRNYYFVPYSQDDPIKKERSLIANFNLILETTEKAIDGKQIQPILFIAP